MHFDKYMTVQPVCFTVTNPSLGQSTLYGQRFTDGTISPLTPAIVLVHGIASSTLNWDFSPTWSVARALAAKGYVVYSYDRLGYASSSYYDHPGGGYTLTTSAHRDELHDIVGDDWRVAAGLAVAIGLTSLLTHEGVNAWWLLPIAIALLLAGSLWREARGAS